MTRGGSGGEAFAGAIAGGGERVVRYGDEVEPMAAVVANLHREYQQAIREEQNDPWFRKYSGEAACA